jgi:hypothetical protein
MQNIYEARPIGKCKFSLYEDKDEVILLLIGGELWDEFDWLYIHDNGIIEAKHNCKWYAFNPTDLTPIKLFIKGKYRLAFDWLDIDSSGFIKAKHDGEYYDFKPDGEYYDFKPDLTPIRTCKLAIGPVGYTYVYDDGIIMAEDNNKFYTFNTKKVVI